MPAYMQHVDRLWPYVQYYTSSNSMDFTSLDFGTSAILGDVSSEKNDLVGSGSNRTQLEQFRTTFELPGDDSGSNDTSRTSNNGEKQYFSASGKVVKLRKRAPKASESTDSLGVSEMENFIDMDKLFKTVELRNSLKSSIKASKQPSQSKNVPLLTEKYKPASFVDLCSLGNDKQYRMVLQWLKKWSPMVFGEPIPAPESKTTYNRDFEDPYGRPHKKIMLIHGPPGIGKTAAAHVFARQMKYNVQEINAANSMDINQLIAESDKKGSRGAYASLKLKITNALTSNSVVGKGKPTCIIIDEIDTSPNSNEIIRVLSDIVRLDGRSNKSSKKPFLMQRPIICIANSNYLTRQGNNMDVLRSISESVAFKKPNISSGSKKSNGNALKNFKEHLIHIAKKEDLNLDYRAIGEIVEICEGDMRACLNYIQFNSQKLNVPIMETKPGGGPNKDSDISWFALVNLLFKRNSNFSKEENFQQLFDLLLNGGGASSLSSSGTFDKVLTGCFSRYLDVIHFQSDTLFGPAELSDWVSLYDRRGSHRLEADYMPSLICLKIWSLFSCPDPNLNPTNELIPNGRSIDFESYEALKSNEQILEHVVGNLPPSLVNALGVSKGGKETLAGSLLPYLDKMIMADPICTGSKSMLTLSAPERNCLEKVSAIVKDLDLRLESHKAMDSNQVLLKMNPDWDSIVHFQNHSQGKFAAKQMRRKVLFPLIASQLEKDKIVKNTTKRHLYGQKESEKKRSKLEKIDEFFQSLRPRETGPTKSATHELTRIWVKYNEGFSNAVRKNIGWTDFWRAGAS